VIPCVSLAIRVSREDIGDDLGARADDSNRRLREFRERSAETSVENLRRWTPPAAARAPFGNNGRLERVHRLVVTQGRRNLFPKIRLTFEGLFCQNDRCDQAQVRDTQPTMPPSDARGRRDQTEHRPPDDHSSGEQSPNSGCPRYCPGE